MSPLDQLPVPLQLLIGGVTFALIFVIGRYVLLVFGIFEWLWIAFRSGRKIEDTDESHRSMSVPPQYAELRRLIYDLDYLPFGAMRLTFVRTRWSTLYHIFRSPDETSTVRFHEAAPPALRLTLMTWFEDDSLIVTEYPRGKRLETDRLVHNFLRGSLAAAHAYHERRVAEWTAQGRVVKLLAGMDDYLRQQAYFLTHYLPLFGLPERTQTLVLLIPTLLVALAAVGLLVGIYTAQPVFSAAMLVVMGAAFFARVKLVARFLQSAYSPPGAADDGQSPGIAG